MAEKNSSAFLSQEFQAPGHGEICNKVQEGYIPSALKTSQTVVKNPEKNLISQRNCVGITADCLAKTGVARRFICWRLWFANRKSGGRPCLLREICHLQ